VGAHGRSKRNNAQILSKRIGELTEDGEELMRIMFAIARDEDAPTSDRRGAVEWLTDRWAGKAPIVIEHDVQHSLQLVDTSKLSLAELRSLEQTLVKMLPAGVEPEIAGLDPDIIEAQAVEAELLIADEETEGEP
jgi:hypothetical protein